MIKEFKSEAVKITADNSAESTRQIIDVLTLQVAELQEQVKKLEKTHNA